MLNGSLQWQYNETYLAFMIIGEIRIVEFYLRLGWGFFLIIFFFFKYKSRSKNK